MQSTPTYLLVSIILTVAFTNACCGPPSEKSDNISVDTKVDLKIIKILKEDSADSKDIQFKVEYYNEHQNWACIYVEPFVMNEFTAEPRWALFRKDNAVWHRIDWSKDMIFKSDFELIDLPIRNSRISKLIVEKYPDFPMEIFPKE